VPVRVVVVGGGFGGLSAAYALREAAGAGVELLVVDASRTFLMGLRKLWLVDGRGTRTEGERDRTRLPARGIAFRQGRVEGIDPDARRVRLDGEALRYDFLVLASGAQPRPDLVPGMAADRPGLFNLYDAADAERLGARLRDLGEGRVVVAIAGLPYKCPPAPYEAAFLIDDLLRRTGRRQRVELEVLSPQPSSLPSAGPQACEAVEGELVARGIRFRPRTVVEAVEDGRLVLAGGERVAADVVAVVPPHRPAPAVAASGLAGEGGWVRVDPATLATADERVFAVGDVVALQTGAGLPFPKAGIFAERQGAVVGRNLAALLAGRSPSERFDGYGYCFIEVGGGLATRVEGNFFTAPPQVRVVEPRPEHLQEKVAFERERLARWFPETAGAPGA